MIRAIFVAGTDTDVGKTWICGLLLAYLREQGLEAGYQKWVATGPEFPPTDLRHCLNTAGMTLEPEQVKAQVPFHFVFPASPHLAAEQEGRVVDPRIIRQRYDELCAVHAPLVVEGVGGVMVPLNRELLLIDLLAELRIPTLLVARSGLGTINHTLLTVEALRRRHIPLLGVVCSDAQEAVGDARIMADNLRTIAEMGKLPVFGHLPHRTDPVMAKALFAPIGQAILSCLRA